MKNSSRNNTMENIRSCFLIYQSDPELVYLDSAATAQKPQVVLDAMWEYYTTYTANASRGLYPMAERTTDAIAHTRTVVRDFLHAKSEREVIFTAGSTEGMNMLARGLAHTLDTDSNIVVTALEHHSASLPWKESAAHTGTQLRTAKITPTGMLDQESLLALCDAQTRIVALTHMSNVTGETLDIPALAAAIRAKSPTAAIILDASQSVAHIPVDTRVLGVDALVFSAHKLYGPTGTGVLWGTEELLNALRNTDVGGGTVLDACAVDTEYKDLPERLEAGTPNIAGIIGLGAAVQFVQSIGFDAIAQHDAELYQYTVAKLTEIFGDRITIIYKNRQNNSSIVSFVHTSIHPHDLAQILGDHHVCIRAGEHCAAPLHRSLDLAATARVSFGVYTTTADIDALVAALRVAEQTFGITA